MILRKWVLYVLYEYTYCILYVNLSLCNVQSNTRYVNNKNLSIEVQWLYLLAYGSHVHLCTGILKTSKQMLTQTKKNYSVDVGYKWSIQKIQ